MEVLQFPPPKVKFLFLYLNVIMKMKMKIYIAAAGVVDMWATPCVVQAIVDPVDRRFWVKLTYLFKRYHGLLDDLKG